MSKNESNNHSVQTGGVEETARRARRDSFMLRQTPAALRNEALAGIADALQNAREEIIAANRIDMAAAEEGGLPDPLIKRLLFDEQKFEDTLTGLREVIRLPDPVGRVLMQRELDTNFVLTQITCPIGVIGVIFESRPDALVQIASLCLKSGNAALLKGGSEAMHTNRRLYEVIHGAGMKAGLPEGFLSLLESREETTAMLEQHGLIDLIIPRGSNEFVRYIMDYSQIPVMGHADGICHVYVDRDFDAAKAVPIILDSKTQYVAVCNAVETVLVHADAADALLPPLREALLGRGVEIREGAYGKEYLDYIVSLNIVPDIDAAIEHINSHGSHHTDAIVTEDDGAAARFFAGVDSASVYRNCSTRFADGFRYGFGAEVGVSTGKLHARGPVGLGGLVTYKYELVGDGNLVADYAEGRRAFRFKDIVIQNV